MTDTKDAPWKPITNLQDLKTLGKLGEELGECQSAIMRCIIQGINEVHPITKYENRRWLEDEIADVLANIELVTERFCLNKSDIQKRSLTKKTLLLAWQSAPED